MSAAFLLGFIAIAGCSSNGDDDDGPSSTAGSGPDSGTGVDPKAGSGSAGSGMIGTNDGGSGQSGSNAGGTGGMGGMSGSDAMSGSGGSAGDDGEDGGSVNECIYVGEPILDPADLPSCETDTCKNAHCLATSAVTESQAEALADCDAENKCVPDLFIETLGKFLLPSCTSLLGAEGRCVSTCVPQVSEQLDALPQDVCNDEERCAPCYDPITGEDTGACSQSCDEGPTEDPVTFPTCCGGLSVCVPLALVPEEQQDLLNAEGCSGEGVLCAPKDMASDRDLLPPTCTSLAGAEGRCLLACLPDVAAQADRLPPADCAEGHLCAPCFDPVSGEATSACTINDDEPAEAPVVFAECCGGHSVCVPDSLVSQDQQALLDANTCTGENELCAPKDIASSSYVPRTCESVGGFEGRCLLTCLPDVAERADQLEQDICEDFELCVPCYDPLTGEDTSACTLEGDEPAEPNPQVFPTCCDDGAGNDLGTCVPTDLVPAEQQGLLGVDTCEGSNVLCAPTDIAQGQYEPETCMSWGGGEGRCLPSCLPDIAAQADRLEPDLCGAGKLCAPCVDPLTGEDTGSCTLEGDMPVQEPPYEFPTCCDDGTGNDLGTCVPSELVPEDQRGLLGADSCSDDGFLCAPTDVANDAYTPIDCNSWLGAEGRCLPMCLPDVEAQAAQLQDPATDSCTQGKLCVPCFNPIDGTSTGACTLPPDEPEEPAETFPRCCNTNGTDRGTCVPARAAGAQAESLPNLNCETLTNDADDYVCAPTEKVIDAEFQFPSCTTVFTGPSNCGLNALCALARGIAQGYIEDKQGACVAACFVSEQPATEIPLYGTYTINELYGQSTCATGEECAPCEYPEGHDQAGEPTGLCE